MQTKVAGIILAGGKSKRFGRPKAFATRQGIPFYRFSLETLKLFSSSIVLVTNSELSKTFEMEKLSVPVITDLIIYQGQGPLAGIYSAMETIVASWYIVLPTDVPFIEQWVIEQMLTYTDQQVDAIIPTVAGQDQPLIAIYNYSIKWKVVEQLNKGERSLHKLLKVSNVKYIKIEDSRPFLNINHQKDYQQYVD